MCVAWLKHTDYFPGDTTRCNADIKDLTTIRRHTIVVPLKQKVGFKKIPKGEIINQSNDCPIAF
jgi:hypothetical protein